MAVFAKDKETGNISKIPEFNEVEALVSWMNANGKHPELYDFSKTHPAADSLRAQGATLMKEANAVAEKSYPNIAPDSPETPYDFATAPMRAAYAGYATGVPAVFKAALSKGMSLMPGYAKPVNEEDLNVVTPADVRNKFNASKTSELVNPVNLAPGLGEEKAIKFGLTKIGEKLGPAAVVEFAKDYPKIASGLKGVARGLGYGTTTTVANAVENAGGRPVEKPSFGQAAAGVGISGGVGGGLGFLGKLMQNQGISTIEEAVKVNPSIWKSANQPEVKNLLEYNNPITGETENLISPFASISDIRKTVGTKINDLNEVNPDITKRLGSNPNVRVNAATALKKTADDYEAAVLAGNMSPANYDKAMSIIDNEAVNLSVPIIGKRSKDIPLAEIRKKVADLDPSHRERILTKQPFDLAYAGRKRMDKEAEWGKARQMDRDVLAEEVHRDLRGNLTKEMQAGVKPIIDPDQAQAELNAIKDPQVPINENANIMSYRDVLQHNVDKTNQAKEDIAKFNANQEAYAKLLPWSQPLEQASRRDMNRYGLGIMELMPLVGGGVYESQGDNPGMGVLGGLMGAAAIARMKRPGTGSALYSIGKNLEKGGLGRIATRTANTAATKNKKSEN